MIVLPVIAVYGRWPRSGTTMLTRVLDAGGALAIRDLDGPYAPDWGCHEATYAPVNLLSKVTSRSAVKLWAPQLRALATAGYLPAAVVTPMRPLGESNASWLAHGWDEPLSGLDLLERWGGMIAYLESHGVPCWDVNFHDLIDQSARECHRLADVLPGEWDVPAMVAVPDPTSRHHGPRRSALTS